MESRKGFTLVELLIVVLILGALAAIAIPRILGGATSAKVNACKANTKELNAQIEIYRANNDVWPSSLEDVTSNFEIFPDGPPECPFGTPYIINSTTHRVNAHNH